MIIKRCECGGRFDVEYLHLVVMKAAVDPTTGKWGIGKKVYERDDSTALPKFICRKCKQEFVPSIA